MARSQSPTEASREGTADEHEQTQQEPAIMDSPTSSPVTTLERGADAQGSSGVPSKEHDAAGGQSQPSTSAEKKPALSMSPTQSISQDREASTSATSPPAQHKKQSSGDVTARRRQARGSHRNSSYEYEYKETLDATTKHLEDGSRIINQYRLSGMIGQGAYGSVFEASLIHDPSVKFAVKEFGKTRLRKNLRAANLRRPLGRGGIRTRAGFAARGGRGGGRSNQNKGPEPMGEEKGSGAVDNAAKDLSSLSLGEEDQKKKGSSQSPAEKDGSESLQAKKTDSDDPLALIRHEIAILKKLDHPNVVELYEVLDDPSKDGLYMVFEFCADGRIIDVKLHEQVKPLDEETARDYFVQIMLGIEYLHHNDIVHRDIKPDNILLQDGKKTCKIVDFGVSEMFMKPGDDTLHKSAGSPAFMSPELCSAHHGDFHGKHSDIWSLGITLFCMVAGRLPFDKSQFLELYEAITNDEPEYPSHLSDNCKSLLQKLLKKKPKERITFAEMRQEPFVTSNGRVKVISEKENTSALVVEVTDEEVDGAIKKIASVFTLARAISKFKRAGSRASSTSSIGEMAGQWIQKGKDLTQSAAGAEAKAEGTEKGSSDTTPPSMEHYAAAHIAIGAQSTAHAAKSTAKSIAKTVLEKGSNVISSPDEVDQQDKKSKDSVTDKSEKETKDYFGSEEKRSQEGLDGERGVQKEEDEDEDHEKHQKGQPLLGKTAVSSPMTDDLPNPQNASPAYDGHSPAEQSS